MTSHSNNRKVRLTIESLEDRALPSLEAFGSVAGSIGVVQVVDSSSPTDIIYSFIPYKTNFTGGVRVAIGSEPNPDGTTYHILVTAAGPGGGPEICVYNLTTGLQMFNFMAFDSNFRGGAFVAVGDVNGDGYDDIIVGAGAGGGPQVKVFSGNTPPGQMPKVLSSFYAYASTFTGGVSVAAGRVNSDGQVNVVTAPGPGGGPLIKEFDGTTGLLVPPPDFTPFFALNSAFRGGISVATGPDVSIAGASVSLSDVIVGAGPGGGPEVGVYANGTLRQNFYAITNQAYNSGINVAAYVEPGTAPSGGPNTVIVVGTDSTTSSVLVFAESYGQLSSTSVLPGLTPGVFVGADNSTPSPPPPASMTISPPPATD